MENWKKVHLSKEEEEGVTVEDSEICEVDIFRRTIVGKIWSERSFNVRAFKQTITQALRLKNPVEIQDLNKNLFIFRFATKKDLENVLKYGPWSFDRNIIVLRRISGEEQPSELEMHTVSFWARVYDLPFKLRAESMAKKIGDIIGKYEEMDNKEEANCMGRFLRIKVAVDLRQPLKRGTVIRFQGKSLKVGFKYERLPTFCFACGRIGHQLKDCEDIEEGELQFGPWLRASPLTKEQRKDSSSGTVGISLFLSTGSNSNKNGSQGEKGVDVEVEQNEENGNPEKQQQEEASNDKGKEKEKSSKDVDNVAESLWVQL